MWPLKVLGRHDVCFRCVGVRDRQRENKKGGGGLEWCDLYVCPLLGENDLSAEEKQFCLSRMPRGHPEFFCFLKESDYFFNGKASCC